MKKFTLMKKFLFLFVICLGVFSTPAMAEKISLISGVDQSGIADRHAYQHYIIRASAGDTVKVNLFNQDADGDLYVKIGRSAARSLFDCKSTNGGRKNESCSVTLTQNANVYIAVYAYKCISNVQHDISAKISHSTAPIQISSGITIRGKADKKQYQHYIISASAGDTVKVNLFDQDADGDLYVNVGQFATKKRFDCKSDNGKKENESCTVTLTKDANVYIAVYAYNCITNVQHSIKATINPANRNYGKIGSFANITKEGNDKGNYTVYYPSNIASMNPKTPLIFMVAGGSGMTASMYQVLIRFMVSHGNTVVVSKGSFDPDDIIGRLEDALVARNVLPYPYVDTKKIGVVGHSTGGGNAFNVLKHFSNKGYGSNGRFILSFDPFYVRAMSESDLQTLPSNTNAIIVQSSKNGMNSDEQTPKIALTIYSLLDSIPSAHKDYQVYSNDGHGYIVGGTFNSVGVANMGHVLKPLDALMDYTFNKTASAHSTALDIGSDHPISDGSVTILQDSKYGVGCKPRYNPPHYEEIDFCTPDGL